MLILAAVVVAEVVPPWLGARRRAQRGRGRRPRGRRVILIRPGRRDTRTAPHGDDSQTIEESGRRIGGHAWVEMRLFEKLGRWSGVVD